MTSMPEDITVRIHTEGLPIAPLDYFAGYVLTGLLADPDCVCQTPEHMKALSAVSYTVAKAMMEEKAKHEAT